MDGRVMEVHTYGSTSGSTKNKVLPYILSTYRATYISIDRCMYVDNRHACTICTYCADTYK